VAVCLGKLEQKVDPTMAAVATMLIALSCLSLALALLLMRRSGVLKATVR